MAELTTRHDTLELDDAPDADEVLASAFGDGAGETAAPAGEEAAGDETDDDEPDLGEPMEDPEE